MDFFILIVMVVQLLAAALTITEKVQLMMKKQLS
jgi:hypothetical protein